MNGSIMKKTMLAGLVLTLSSLAFGGIPNYSGLGVKCSTERSSTSLYLGVKGNMSLTDLDDATIKLFSKDFDPTKVLQKGVVGSENFVDERYDQNATISFEDPFNFYYEINLPKAKLKVAKSTFNAVLERSHKELGIQETYAMTCESQIQIETSGKYNADLAGFNAVSEKIKVAVIYNVMAQGEYDGWTENEAEEALEDLEDDFEASNYVQFMTQYLKKLEDDFSKLNAKDKKFVDDLVKKEAKYAEDLLSDWIVDYMDSENIPEDEKYETEQYLRDNNYGWGEAYYFAIVDANNVVYGFMSININNKDTDDYDDNNYLYRIYDRNGKLIEDLETYY